MGREVIKGISFKKTGAIILLIVLGFLVTMAILVLTSFLNLYSRVRPQLPAPTKQLRP